MSDLRQLFEPYRDHHFFIVADSIDDAIAYYVDYSGEAYDEFEMVELDLGETIRIGYYEGSTIQFDRAFTYQEILDALIHIGEAYLVNWDDIQMTKDGVLDLGYLVSSARM